MTENYIQPLQYHLLFYKLAHVTFIHFPFLAFHIVVRSENAIRHCIKMYCQIIIPL